jgi:hypothetical protein
LYVDGGITCKGVEKNIRLFVPLVPPGSYVVFDDFAQHLPSLAEALDVLVTTQGFPAS